MKKVSLLKSSLWITFSTFIPRVFALLSNLVLARLLLPSEFGVIGIAYVFWSFFTLFTQNSTGLFIVYKGTDDKRYLNTTYTISLIIGLVVALGLAASSPLIAKFFDEPNLTLLLMAYAFNLQLSSIYYIYYGIMTRQMQYREQTNIGLIGSMIRLCFTTGSALLGLSYWSFAIGDTASWIVSCILMRSQSGHRLRLQIDSEVKSEVLSFCLGASGSSFGYYINANIDNLVVGKLLGALSLGYYNLAYQLTMTLSTIGESVANQLGVTIFAQLSDDKQQENALFKTIKEVAFLSAPMYALIFLILNHQLIAFLFGSQWTPVATVIPWLLIFAYFRVVNGSLKSMLSAKGRPDIDAKVNLIIAPIAVLSFIIGAQHQGIIGVSVAVALVLGIVWTLYGWWFGCRELGWSMMKFIIPVLTPVLMVLPALAISVNLHILLRPFAFLIIYLIIIRVAAPQQFSSYVTLVKLLVDRLKKIV
jgi:lipopolysaccharide exporter